MSISIHSSIFASIYRRLEVRQGRPCESSSAPLSMCAASYTTRPLSQNVPGKGQKNIDGAYRQLAPLAQPLRVGCGGIWARAEWVVTVARQRTTSPRVNNPQQCQRSPHLSTSATSCFNQASRKEKKQATPITGAQDLRCPFHSFNLPIAGLRSRTTMATRTLEARFECMSVNDEHDSGEGNRIPLKSKVRLQSRLWP